MKYQLGDTILLIHSGEEGQVVEMINDKMVMVEIGKVRFPVYLDQIDFPYFKRFTEKKFEPPKSHKKYIDDIRKEKVTANAKYKVANGVWLSFLPVFDKDVFDDDVVERFKLFLVNQSADELLFNYTLHIAGKEGFQLKNTIHPFTDFYLHDVFFEDMNDAPKFDFEFSLAKPDKLKAEYFESTVKIKAKQLFNKIEETRIKNEPTFSYQLFDLYPNKLEEVKPDYSPFYGSDFKVYDAKKIRQNLEPARSVVDLHIEKLSNDWKHLSNFEILTIQLKAFEKYYDLAIAHRQPQLILIHGIGTGKLKDEIHELLKNKRNVKSFVNQYSASYGYGATEVYLGY